MEKKYKIILNPTANRNKAVRAIPIIEKILNNKSISYDLVITKKAGETKDLARNAIGEYHIVVAAGGDGTVAEAINGIVNREVGFGIIPLGSGNDFAKALGYGNNLKKNIDILLTNNKKPIDLGKVNDYYFVNNVSIGFDAVVAKTFNRGKNIMLGKTAYINAIFKALWRLRSYHFRLTTSDFDSEVNITLAAITNSPTYGGGIPINPSAKIDDGLFNICLVDKMSRLFLIKSLPKLLKGKHINLPEVKTFTAKKITIASEEKLPISFDGEVIDDSERLKIEVLSGAIEIIGK